VALRRTGDQAVPERADILFHVKTHLAELVKPVSLKLLRSFQRLILGFDKFGGQRREFFPIQQGGFRRESSEQSFLPPDSIIFCQDRFFCEQDQVYTVDLA
jgi:hypothetical protein